MGGKIAGKVARCDDDAKSRPLSLGHTREVQPAHRARHANIGEKNVNILWIIFEKMQRLIGIRGSYRVKPGIGQNVGGERPDGGLIIDDQNASGQDAAPSFVSGGTLRA
jgi:hypothetical protein